MGRVENKIALVTGAARGQGRSHAVRLAGEGADIIAVDICAPIDGIGYPMATHEDLEATRDLVIKAGRRVIALEVDIRERHALTEAVEAAVTELGGLDIVVANAGVAALGRWSDLDWQQWDAIVGVNLTGTWNTMTAAIPHLRARGGGSVVATSSVAGVVGLPFAEAYAASKHGVIGLVRSLSIELAEEGIRFNAVCPTGVSGTGMLQALAGVTDIEADDRVKSAFLNAFQVDTVEPSDVSSAVLYLASDESRYVTGTAMSVDAGLISL
ncbi:mycofactocin-coupled SDR family oxidoreductase [Streptomyces sp. NPDC001068]|uniref:mycofactocin-coupled SDR family oxidoreductase n=1 Tax=Streptomyces sp. NPDC001068 TaxID=3364544 RepID=UPI0036947187